MRSTAAVVALVAVAGCSKEESPRHEAKAGEAAHWSYEGADGPAAWASLSTDYTRCADGSAQSPIAVGHPQDKPLPDLHFDYRTARVEIEDTGHTEQVNVEPGSSVVLDGVTYGLAQFHYHAPSEHTVDGRSFPAEFHFVHKSDTGALAVVGLLVKAGRHNPAWDPILEHLPNRTNEPVTVDALDLKALFPADLGTTRYEGSLTTPPCSEGVHWNLLSGLIDLNDAQLSVLTGHYDHNNRPVQPLAGRPVVHDSTVGD
ncbi:MAG TPA: carbonic anhydrase family protein [Acidimicrobiia bacterium]|nr:carbonic anhydrase family protein [Acidimicrobiia bacterium]